MKVFVKVLYFLCRCSHFLVAVVCRHVEGQVSCDMMFYVFPRVLELCCFGFRAPRHTLQRLHSLRFAGQGESLCGNVPPQFLQGLVVKLSFF